MVRIRKAKRKWGMTVTSPKPKNNGRMLKTREFKNRRERPRRPRNSKRKKGRCKQRNPDSINTISISLEFFMGHFTCLLLHIIQHNVIQSFLYYWNLQYLQLILRLIKVNLYLGLTITHFFLKTNSIFLHLAGSLNHLVLFQHLNIAYFIVLTVSHKYAANTLKCVIVHQCQLDHLVASPKSKCFLEKSVLLLCWWKYFIFILVIYGKLLELWPLFPDEVDDIVQFGCRKITLVQNWLVCWATNRTIWPWFSPSVRHYLTVLILNK